MPNFNVGDYGGMVTLAIISAFFGSVWAGYRMGFPTLRSVACLFAAGVATLIGARFLYWISRPPVTGGYSFDDLTAVSPTGFALYGGLISGICVAFVLARWLKLDAFRLADGVTIPIALAIAIIRLGCCLQGCCYGTTTDLPWAYLPTPASPAYFHQVMSSPVQAMAEIQPVHPTQVYEMLAALLVALLAIVLLLQKRRPGETAIIAFLVFTILRWIVFPLRAVQAGGEADVIIFQTLYPTILIGLAFVWFFYVRQPQTEFRSAGECKTRRIV